MGLNELIARTKSDIALWGTGSVYVQREEAFTLILAGAKTRINKQTTLAPWVMNFFYQDLHFIHISSTPIIVAALSGKIR